ncbi:hypothetical protein CYLTODRAFT_359091, partial [Cylindrobasidium torrendii FP15055 ss-10]
VPFGVTYVKLGTIQRRLAWPLHKDDTLLQSGSTTVLNIYCFAFHWLLLCRRIESIAASDSYSSGYTLFRTAPYIVDPLQRVVYNCQYMMRSTYAIVFGAAMLTRSCDALPVTWEDVQSYIVTGEAWEFKLQKEFHLGSGTGILVLSVKWFTYSCGGISTIQSRGSLRCCTMHGYNSCAEYVRLG